MINTEYHWKSFDNTDIFGQWWKPEGEIKFVINIVHGIGEHCGRYANWAKMFTEQGIAVLSIDYRGHGKSSGKRGHTADYEDLLRDMSLLLHKSESLFPEIPKIVYGHSLGGNIVLNYLLRKTPLLAGAIITSPWLKLAFEPPKVQLVAGKIVKSILPAFTQSTNLDINSLSRDKNVVEAYEKDELVHGKISANMFFNCYKSGLWALENAKKTYIPLLLMHGSEDKITLCDASQKFAQKSDLITFKCWEGFYHELHNEPGKEDVFSFIMNWINENIQQNRTTKF